jgi:dipeptidyl aminopeptidase/acylaminoacyl peptidase
MCALAVGAQARPFTVHDLVAMERISDPQVSPDGTQVVFTVTTMDLEANRGRNDLWIAAVDGSGARRLTTHAAGDWNPRWTSDRELVFLSSRGDSAQVWRISLDGGEARQVTDLPLDVEAVMVGAEAQLFVAMRVFPECDRDVQCTVDKVKAEQERRTSGQIYDELFVRHWDRWIDGRRNHIFRLGPAGDDGLVHGATDLMPGVDGDCPTVPWGGPDDVTFSPDGQWAVYTAKVVEGSEEAWSTNWDLWAVPTDGSEPPRCLTSDNPAWDTAPQFSPDGTTLAYLAMERAGYESDRRRVILRSWPDGEPQAIAPEWDRSPGGLTWTRDGSALLATADNVGHHSLFRIDAASGAVSALVTERTNRSPSPLPDGSVLLAQDSLVSPVELKVVGPAGGELRSVTDLNGERLADLQLGSYDQFEFTGAHGDTVYGFLIKPVGFDPEQTYPLAFLVHGGPQGSFGDHWHYRWNPEIYAAHGYATVMIDFHGSTGYGQEFTDSIRGDWGGAPFEDLMKGLDWVLAYAPWIDSERMAALGASYGGYMINWIQGNTDRFQALVCHDGNLDEYMAYFDTEELWFPEWEHGGTPWENPEGYRKHSPASKLDSWSTPELVIHGQKDYRVVVTQGLGTFNALQRLGVPSRLLYFPDENHWVLKPLNSIQWHEVVLDWIDRWTATE